MHKFSKSSIYSLIQLVNIWLFESGHRLTFKSSSQFSPRVYIHSACVKHSVYFRVYVSW